MTINNNSQLHNDDRIWKRSIVCGLEMRCRRRADYCHAINTNCLARTVGDIILLSWLNMLPKSVDCNIVFSIGCAAKKPR